MSSRIGKLKAEDEMKWIVVAGPSNTGKTYTLAEVVIELTKRGGVLVPPSAMPVWNAVVESYYDATYELSYASKKIFVVTGGDSPWDVESGFDKAKAAKADVLVSASRSKSGSGHLAAINARISQSVEPYFIAALEHDKPLQPRIRANRVGQIIDLI